MYEAYWNLSQKPFQYRTAVSQCYAVQSQRAALLRLQYCIENSAGCALLLGESGLGKTTLLKMLESTCSSLRPFVLLAFPGLEPIEQLRIIAGRLSESDSEPAGGTDGLLLSIYSSFLEETTEMSHHPVICFDDAQLMTPRVMTDVVLPLLNIRDFDDRLNFTIILSGQPILAADLARQPQLRERTAVTAKLSGLTRDETRTYVRSRMEACGADGNVFADSALSRLQDISHGNPRRLNRLCDMALLVACAEELSWITAREIDCVSTELLSAA